MAKKTDTKTGKIEREYVIPLREKCRVVPRYKKTNKAIKTIKEFLAKHMNVEDRDLKKVRLDMYLNEAVWKRGIKKPLHKVKVKAVKEDGIVRAELLEMPAHLKFKKAREEKLEKASEAVAKGKKAEKAKEEAETKKEVVEEIAESGVPKTIAKAEEALDEKEQAKAPEKTEEDEVKEELVAEEKAEVEKEMAKEDKKEVKPKTPTEERKEETTRDASY